MENLYGLYYAVAWNRKLAAANDARANVFADATEAAFGRDKVPTQAYDNLAGGKRDGMMLQTNKLVTLTIRANGGYGRSIMR